ncbi:MAG: hypothetical protein LBS42_06230 [Tannerella sp.]|nr:hypothetical protein [Tannerella sp.]
MVGNGKYLVKTTPERFVSVKNLNISGSFRFFRGNEELLPAASLWNATIFPGGAAYDIRTGWDSLHVLYGVLPATGFMVCIMTASSIRTELLPDNSIPLFRREILNGNMRLIFYLQNDVPAPASDFDKTVALLQQRYRENLILESPNRTLDKAVAFSQYLLDLGYNGKMMLCEIFRWQDIWARDLGSGLLPGALASGRAAMARQSLDYDLGRYALMSPADCKNSNDPSQGGTSSGIGWTARSAWNYYMYSGDLNTLGKDADIIRPWVAHWTERDYDDDGLIIDVTEFMDHMIMMLTTNGVYTLAANSMYASLLNCFSKIEEALGHKAEARRLQGLYNRTVNAINTVYWNEEKGYFNNMVLWDIVSRRSSQASQSMLLKIGATDRVRAEMALDYLKKNNWCDYGSITITPRMNHVDLDNDQNVKVWPWWNLWESEARFRYGDKTGGYRLLELAARTIEYEQYPGMIEETLEPHGGVSTGGNVFVTAAGNLLDVVVRDLMGIEALTPGWSRIKVTPSVPSEWESYNCMLPTLNGRLSVSRKNGQLTISVEDDRIREVFVSGDEHITVVGAQKRIYTPENTKEPEYRTVNRTPVPPLSPGKAALFYDSEFHAAKPDLDMDVIDVEGLGNLLSRPYKKIVIKENALPLYTKTGRSIKKILDSYVNKGGTVVFYGAKVNVKSEVDGAGLLGEQCGIIDWYQYLPTRGKTWLSEWTHNDGIYTTSFHGSPALTGGKDIYVEIGPLVGLDSLFINGVYAANYRDMEPFIHQEYPTKTKYPDSHRYRMLSRMYIIKPGTAAYRAIRTHAENTLSLKISGNRPGFDFPGNNRPNISIVIPGNEWQATDEALPDMGFGFPKRKGINYWGNEQFFNSWSTKNGLFGFAIDGTGIQFCKGTALEGLADMENVPVDATYTNFALFKPWTFEILAYTVTRQNLLYPMKEERYPCIVRIVNAKTKGGYILINPSIAELPTGIEILNRLKINTKKLSF